MKGAPWRARLHIFEGTRLGGGSESPSRSVPVGLVPGVICAGGWAVQQCRDRKLRAALIGVRPNCDRGLHAGR
jgi:hypothetical protein